MHHRSAHIALIALLVLAAALAVGVGRAAAFGFTPHADFATGTGPYSVAVGDFNGDGKQDLATANMGDQRYVVGPTASVLLGDGNGGFGAKTDFTTGSGSSSIAVGDFNGDGKQDLATANRTANTVSVLLGNGSGGFAAKTDFATGASPWSIAVGDFNGDGKLDIVTGNRSANTVSVLLGDGSGGFGAKTDFATAASPCSIAVGDFNGDGKQDLATANLNTSTASVLLGDGSGGFGAKTDFATGSGSWSIAVGDFNGDGKQDLATANFTASTASILLGDGSGGFGAKTDFATGASPWSIAVGDFNGDGKLDLVTANGDASSVSVLLGDGSGGFGAKTDFTTGSGPTSIAVGDFNGDGRQDLATANYGADTASVLLGTEPPAGTMAIEGGAAATSNTLVRIDSAVSDAAQMRLRDQGSAWSAWLPYGAWIYWILPAGDGTKTVEAQYRNFVGQTLIVSDSILLDTTAPITTDDAPADWQAASPVIVTFTPDDGTGSGMSGGLATTQYKLDGAKSWTNDTGVKVGTDGTHTIAYRSIDAVGNVGDIESCTVKIDTTAPTTTVRGISSAWQAWPQTVFLTAADAGSGMSGGKAQIEYNLDGAGWTTGDWIVVSTDGDHTLHVRATDAVGNTEKPQKMEVMVDRTAPTTTDNTDGLPHQVFSLVLSPTDATSGVATTQYRIDGGPWQTGTTTTLRLAIRHKRAGLASGSHTVDYRSTDAAGNVETIKSCTVTLSG